MAKRQRQKMPRYSDFGTPERHARAGGAAVIEGDETPHVRLFDTEKLDWYLARRYIDETQHVSGLRFRRDFYVAGWECRTIGGYIEWTDSSGGGYAPDAALDAKERTKRALNSLPSINAQLAVINVCGMNEHVGSGRVRYLKEGLDGLTAHYGGGRRRR